jgi:ankyrin repeat protein
MNDFLHHLPKQWHTDERLLSLLEKGAQSNWSEALDGLLSAVDPAVMQSLRMIEATKRALEVAVVSGNAECVDVLLSRGGATLSVQHRSRSGMTLLMLAAWHGHSAAISSLVTRKAAVDARDTGKRTALHFAAVGGHLEAVRLLLAAGADPNAADQDGWTPLADAEHNGHAAVCEELTAHRAKPDNSDSMKAFQKLEAAMSFSNTVYKAPRSWVKPVKDPMHSQVDFIMARQTYQNTLEMLQ